VRLSHRAAGCSELGPLSGLESERPGRAVRGGGALLAALAMLVLLTGCGGGPPGDLFVVTRSGSIPGAGLVLRVTDDGRASCNGGPLVEIPSSDTIAAREARRELQGGDDKNAVGPADKGLKLPPGPGAILRYVVLAEAGTVSFSDTSPRQPQVFRELAALTRRLAKGPCKLPR
jgi:hypothetical protein